MLVFLVFFNMLIEFMGIFSNLRLLSLRKYIYIFNFLILSLHDGLRWLIGVDWQSYITYWDTLKSPINFILTEADIFNMHVLYRQDRSFVLFTRFFHDYISSNYTLYLLFFAIITYGLALFSVAKLTRYSLIALSFFPGFLGWYSGSQRQFFAYSLFFFTLYIIDSKKYKFFLIPLIFFAMNMHVTYLFPILLIATFYIPKILKYINLQILVNFLNYYKNFFIILLTSFSVLIIFLFYEYDLVLIELFLKFVPIKSAGWFEFISLQDAEYGNPLFGTLRKIFNLTYFLFLIKFIKFKEGLTPLNYYLMVSPFVSILLYLVSLYVPQLALNSRLDSYFSAIAILLISGRFFQNNLKTSKLIIFSFCASFLYIEYARHGCYELFDPYHFFFEKDYISPPVCNFEQ